MNYRCRDCKDTKTYQGLGAPERCRSCLYDVAAVAPRLNHGLASSTGETTFHTAGSSVLNDVKVHYKVNQAELLRLINQATKTGENLDRLLTDNGKRWVTLVN